MSDIWAYGCVKCQKWHFDGTAIFSMHHQFQGKHQETRKVPLAWAIADYQTPPVEQPDMDRHTDGEDECWNCGGEGYTYMCQDEISCVDPEGGCDLCMRRCWVCNSKSKSSATPDEN